MRPHARMLGMAWLVLVVASCSALNPPNSKQEANARWGQMRGRLKCELGAEHLDKGRLDEAQKHLEEAISLAPEAPTGYVLMTRVLLERGETASAGEMLAEAVARGGETAETHYLAGLIAERYGRFEEALTRYQRACAADPMKAHYVAATAETLVALDRVSEALALVRDRWTDFEQNATLRWLAGEIYMMTGRYEEAAEAYRQAALIAANDRMLQFQLGVALTLAKRYTEARQVLVAAVAGDRAAPASVLLALGRCHVALGEAEEAKTVLRKVVAGEPDNAQGWCLLSEAALGSGDLLTARRAAAQATQLAPGSEENAMLLGYVCWLQRDYAAAVAALEGVLGKEPDDLMAMYLLGQCLDATGRTDEARRCYQRALRVDPRCDWAKKRLENGSACAGSPGEPWPMPGGGVRSP